MADVNVDLIVDQGSFNAATAAQSIGTDGCTVCVGLVAVMADNTKYCAHFDCGTPGTTPAQRTRIQADTLAALQAAIPAAPAAILACTSANVNQSTGAIWAGIQQFFAAATLTQNANGVYVLANGTTGTPTAFTSWRTERRGRLPATTRSSEPRPRP